MSILWATTFSADLWEHSGRLLVESFVRTGTPGHLAVYLEGMYLPESYPNVTVHRIDDDPILAQLLVANRDVIPVMLGGNVLEPECQCRGGPYDAHYKKHKLPCVGYWFCKNAYRWMRKPLAAKRACDLYLQDFKVMMWVDADASFLRHTPVKTAESWFRGRYGCIYLKNKRSAIETGVFGYHLRYGGQRIAEAVLARYTSGEFRKDQRWDDCVQMARGIAAAKVPAIDIATGLGPRNTVIQFSPMAAYLGHAKGAHLRAGLLK